MIVKIKVVEDGENVTLIGQVDNRVYPPVRMRRGMTRYEMELEAIRRFLWRNQNWRQVTFQVDSYVADVASFRRVPSCSAIFRAVNRVNYLVSRRLGSVFFEARS